MAKGHTQVKRSKPVPRLTSKDVPSLGKNSNKHREANIAAIYSQPSRYEPPKPRHETKVQGMNFAQLLAKIQQG